MANLTGANKRRFQHMAVFCLLTACDNWPIFFYILKLISDCLAEYTDPTIVLAKQHYKDITTKTRTKETMLSMKVSHIDSFETTNVPAASAAPSSLPDLSMTTLCL